MAVLSANYEAHLAEQQEVNFKVVAVIVRQLLFATP